MPYTNTGTYDLSSMIPQGWRGWDEYYDRLSRYEVYEGYYHNVAYHTIVTYSQQLKTTERLYKHVRGVYNPVNRLVESYASKLYGGALDMETAQGGCMPIVTENDALAQAIIALWKASRWGQKKALYPRVGAKSGDVFIKVVDDVRFGHVRLEVVAPSKVKDIDKSPTGEIVYAELEYYVRDANENLVTYTEIITPERFQTRLEGEPTPYHANGRGERVAEWDNDYGFVPMFHALHTDVGLMYGAPAFHGIMHKINELNDLASILNDGMRKQVQMPMFTFGAQVGSVDIGQDKSANSRNKADAPKKDSVPALNFPENARVEFASPAISITDGLENVVNIQKELERDLPELSLHRLRDGSNLTAPGVRSAYDDAISRYQDARANYNAVLAEAQAAAVAIGGMRGYDGYQGFSLASRFDEAAHTIGDRPIINDTLGKSEKLTLTLQAMQANAPRAVFLDMGWLPREVDEIAGAAESAANMFMLSQTGTGNPADVEPLDDPDETPQDALEARRDSGVNENDLLNAGALLEGVA